MTTVNFIRQQKHNYKWHEFKMLASGFCGQCIYLCFRSFCWIFRVKTKITNSFNLMHSSLNVMRPNLEMLEHNDCQWCNNWCTPNVSAYGFGRQPFNHLFQIQINHCTYQHCCIVKENIILIHYSVQWISNKNQTLPTFILIY